jgi:hypothetical protein
MSSPPSRVKAPPLLYQEGPIYVPPTEEEIELRRKEKEQLRRREAAAMEAMKKEAAAIEAMKKEQLQKKFSARNEELIMLMKQAGKKKLQDQQKARKKKQEEQKARKLWLNPKYPTLDGRWWNSLFKPPQLKQHSYHEQPPPYDSSEQPPPYEQYDNRRDAGPQAQLSYMPPENSGLLW